MAQKYYVENWDTDEIIAVFDTSKEREDWIKKNVIIRPCDGAYMEDGTHIAIYEF